MDSEAFARFVIAFLQSMKDWPILSLFVAGFFALVGIPVVMLSKRLLDKLVPTRDARMQALLEDRGGLVEQVKQWRDTAARADASQRGLVEQAAELQRQLTDARKERPDNPDKALQAELTKTELENRITTLRQLLDDKSRELQDRDRVAENALASQRALMDQVTDLNRRLTESQQQLADALTKSQGLRESLRAAVENFSNARKFLRRQAERILRTPILLEIELYGVIFASVSELQERAGNQLSFKIPTLEEVLSVTKGELGKLTIVSDKNEERKMVFEPINPAQEIRRILKELYENFYKRMNDPGVVHILVDPDVLTVHVPSLQQSQGSAMASSQSPDSIGNGIVRALMLQMLQRIDKIVPEIAPLKLRFEWANLWSEEDPYMDAYTTEKEPIEVARLGRKST